MSPVDTFKQSNFWKQDGERLVYFPVGCFGRGYVLDGEVKVGELMRVLGYASAGGGGDTLSALFDALLFLWYFRKTRKFLSTCPRSPMRLTWAEHRGQLRRMWRGGL